MFLIVDFLNFWFDRSADHKSLMIKFNVNNFDQRMYKRRMKFALDFYPNLQHTQLPITSLLSLFRIVTHNFFTSEMKIFENCFEL